MNAVALTGLVQIDLPETTLRYCDGGFFEFEGETFRGEDPVFGTIGALQAMSEGVGDTVPALTMTLLPANDTAPAEISKPGHQTARVRFWIAEYDVPTGVISSSEVMFDGQIDQTVLTVGRDIKELSVSIVSLAERLFEGNIGNTLNPTWHKSVWPGETGHDNATGLSIPIAWGVESPSAWWARWQQGFLYGRRWSRQRAELQALLMELVRRRAATERTLARYRKKVFDWSKGITCVHLARAHLRNMGHKPETLPRFRSALGAKKALQERGFESVTGMLDSMLPRIAPAQMMLGDLAVVPGEGGLDAIFVCAGPLKVFGWREDAASAGAARHRAR